MAPRIRDAAGTSHLQKQKIVSLVKDCLHFSLACVIVFVLIEGISSTLIFVHQVWLSVRAHYPHYTRYDKELGWSNIPNYYDKDCFAPGVYLRTNSRGFRSNEETSDSVPRGKVRLVCSGDSFTLGDGVDNDHTWCQRLSSLNSALETVNMGESGYGVDQMYLLYRRDGASLQHDIHIFAVIGDDFRRMEFTAVGPGTHKPILKLENGSLVAANVPVPRNPPLMSWWLYDVFIYGRPSFNDLRTTRLLTSALDRISPRLLRSFSNEPTPVLPQTISKVIDELQFLNKEKNSILVLVYLPAEMDYNGTDPHLPVWRNLLRQEAGRTGLLLIDLTEDFEKLSPPQIGRFFIHPDAFLSAFGAGHYSNEGNAFVAGKLYSYLVSRPEVQRKLAEVQ